MKRIVQITYEFSEEEYNEMKVAVEEVHDFLKGYTLPDQKYRADEAIDRIKEIVEGTDKK